MINKCTLYYLSMFKKSCGYLGVYTNIIIYIYKCIIIRNWFSIFLSNVSLNHSSSICSSHSSVFNKLYNKRHFNVLWKGLNNLHDVFVPVGKCCFFKLSSIRFLKIFPPCNAKSHTTIGSYFLFAYLKCTIAMR